MTFFPGLYDDIPHAKQPLKQKSMTHPNATPSGWYGVVDFSFLMFEGCSMRTNNNIGLTAGIQILKPFCCWTSHYL